MGFWTSCKKCGSSIFMSQVRPPGETVIRWLPFEDDALDVCHLDYCGSGRGGGSRSSKKKSATHKHVLNRNICSDTFIKCPECSVNLNPKNLKKHLRKIHGAKNQ